MLSNFRRDDSGRPLVLVTSNNDQRRAMYAYVLSAQGFDVMIASGPLLVPSRTRDITARPDLILVDVAGNGDDDWTLMGIVRSHPGIEDVPIIALTSDIGPSARARARREGCAAVCARTCQAPTLVAGLRAVLDQRVPTHPPTCRH
jgi:CheY-like chemotaxis protein